jgi:hypothetical protein
MIWLFALRADGEHQPSKANPAQQGTSQGLTVTVLPHTSLVLWTGQKTSKAGNNVKFQVVGTTIFRVCF